MCIFMPEKKMPCLQQVEVFFRNPVKLFNFAVFGTFFDNGKKDFVD